MGRGTDSLGHELERGDNLEHSSLLVVCVVIRPIAAFSSIAAVGRVAQERRQPCCRRRGCSAARSRIKIHYGWLSSAVGIPCGR